MTNVMSKPAPTPSQAPHPALPLVEVLGAMLAAIFRQSWLWRFLPGARAAAEQMRRLSQDFTALMEHLATLPPVIVQPVAESPVAAIAPPPAQPAPTPKRAAPTAAGSRKPRAPSVHASARPALPAPAQHRAPTPAYPRASTPQSRIAPVAPAPHPPVIFAPAESQPGELRLFYYDIKIISHYQKESASF